MFGRVLEDFGAREGEHSACFEGLPFDRLSPTDIIETARPADFTWSRIRCFTPDRLLTQPPSTTGLHPESSLGRITVPDRSRRGRWEPTRGLGTGYSPRPDP